MEYMGTKEASEKWGYSQAVISKWCREGLVDKAEQDKKGSPWRIPINTECPKKNKIRKKKKMNDKILIKGEIGHIKKIRNVIFTIGMLIVAIPGVVTTGLIIDLLNYKENFPTHYGSISYKEENATIFLAISIILLIICLLITGITYKYLSKISIVVTDKRVYGTAMFGKQIDLPLDSISALGRGMFSSIAVATASGKITFWGISNRDEVHKAISGLLQSRQSGNKQEAVPVTHVTQQSQSSADELMKYKELLDNGIITQEEFDAKKKQLLGL